MFSYENLDNAKTAYDKLIAKVAALKEGGAEVGDQDTVDALRAKFKAAMDNDLNTSLGITALYDVLKAGISDGAKLQLLGEFDTVLGLGILDRAAKKREQDAKSVSSAAGGFTVQGEGDPAIDALVLQRAEAKKAKNFAEADRIRDELKAQGIEVTDVPGGAAWKRV